MIEAEWLASADPQSLLEAFGGRVGRATDRKLRLFACACLRLEPWAKDERLQSVVRIVERYANREATRDELSGAQSHGDALIAHAPNDLLPSPPMRDALTLATASSAAFLWSICWGGHEEGLAPRPFEENLAAEQRGLLCKFFRCILGNPYHPLPTIPAKVLSWSDRTVPRIAQAIYADRAFYRLPILADALLDAGCDDEVIRSHCRSDGPHVRGCRVIDLILGKE